ncbi:hypothetical protein [Vibrio sagamiensis]|uniref:Uncharacterized protein n=1 Tax=Vibrio sagamiensis NBRC 104589 TaxID=1219064 RepID=A0A511QB10_9VIBR|nr:hypothetical protein [Vibrio sagamiensis]GEM74455.1 hypothetical protein VSA01S_05670 [Vibrio sagamiensis NBRC 104589]
MMTNEGGATKAAIRKGHNSKIWLFTSFSIHYLNYTKQATSFTFVRDSYSK